MRTALDALITRKSLDFLDADSASNLFDSHSDDLPLKNVCARVEPELADEIDQLVRLLGITKRRFLEAAFIEAVDRAKAIMRAEGVFDRLKDPEVRFEMEPHDELQEELQ